MDRSVDSASFSCFVLFCAFCGTRSRVGLVVSDLCVLSWRCLFFGKAVPLMPLDSSETLIVCLMEEGGRSVLAVSSFVHVYRKRIDLVLWWDKRPALR